MAFLAIFVIFAPITTFGQQWTEIIIEPEMVLSNGDSNVVAIAVTVDGYLNDNGNLQLIIEGVFDSNDFRKYEEISIVTYKKPTHVFELNYPFTPNEVYQLTAKNGDESNTIEWVPSIPTQKESETEKSQNEPESEVTVERVTAEKSSDANEGVTNVFIQQEANSIVDTFEASNQVQSLIEENELLKQEIEKKDAVIMEQLKVIQNLASQIRNAIFDESTGRLYLIAETSEDSDYIQSLIEENELLKQEIEKKDAVIMEQLKVIQNLASQIRNAAFELSLNYFLIV